MRYHEQILAMMDDCSEKTLKPLVLAWLKDNPDKTAEDFKQFLSAEISNYQRHAKKLNIVAVPIKSLGKDRVKKPKKKMKSDYLDKVVSYITTLFENKKCRVEVSGDYRRGKSSVASLVFVYSGASTDDVYSWLSKHERFTEKGLIAHGQHKLSLLVTVPKVNPFVIEFIKSSIKSFGASQVVHTGSHEFLMYLRMLAKRKHMKLNQYGLWKGDKLLASRKEEDIFDALKLKYMTPENRDVTKMQASKNI